MTITTYDNDFELHKYKEKPMELLPLVARKYKKSGIEIVKEIWKLSRGPGRLPPSDYFLYQLYDDKNTPCRRRDGSFPTRCIGRWCTKSLTAHGKRLVEDKWICYDLLRHNGFPVPRTVAVIDQSIRSFGSDLKISSPAMLKDFLVGAELLSFVRKGKLRPGQPRCLCNRRRRWRPYIARAVGADELRSTV